MTTFEETKRVAVMMDGREASLAAAYLLKKQGFDIVAVSLIFENPEKGIILGEGCRNLDQELIQGQCEELGIPLYFIDIKDEFEDKIWNALVSKKLMGQGKELCSVCLSWRLEIILEKIKTLGIDILATGLFAKTFKTLDNNYFLVRAQDIAKDESHLLIHLKASNLKKCLFPLGDIYHTEVTKLAKSLNIKYYEPDEEHVACYANKDVLTPYISKSVAREFLESGDFYDLGTEEIIGPHKGIYCHHIGEGSLLDFDNISLGSPYKVAMIDVNKRKIYLTKNDGINFDYLYASHFRPTVDLNISRPLIAFLQISTVEKLLPCYIYFKSANYITIFLNKVERKFLSIGQDLVFFSKEGPNAKIIASARLETFGIWEAFNRAKEHIGVNEKYGPELPKTDFSF